MDPRTISSKGEAGVAIWINLHNALLMHVRSTFQYTALTVQHCTVFCCPGPVELARHCHHRQCDTLHDMCFYAPYSAQAYLVYRVPKSSRELSVLLEKASGFFRPIMTGSYNTWYCIRQSYQAFLSTLCQQLPLLLGREVITTKQYRGSMIQYRLYRTVVA